MSYGLGKGIREIGGQSRGSEIGGVASKSLGSYLSCVRHASFARTAFIYPYYSEDPMELLIRSFRKKLPFRQIIRVHRFGWPTASKRVLVKWAENLIRLASTKGSGIVAEARSEGFAINHSEVT